MGGLLLFDIRVLGDGDTYWHLATGDWIIGHGSVPHVDVFSYSRPGIPWVTQEWLSELLMALARQMAGWSGVVALFAVAMAVTAWLIVRRLSQAIGGVTLILASVLTLACMSGGLLARPHLLALPILVIWTLEMLSARSENRAPRLVFALLMIAWANMHGSYLLGLLVAGVFGLEALVETGADRNKVIQQWGLFGVAIFIATLITPHGLRGLTYPIQIMTMSALPGIVEWRAADFSHPSAFEAAVLVTIFVCLWRGVRVPVVRLFLLLLLLYLSLQHVRHQLVLAAMAPLILAEPLALALGHEPAHPRLRVGALAAVTAFAVALFGVRLMYPVVRVDGLNSPVTALAQLPPDLVRQPVLNEYGFGGYLIDKGVRPFIDGRSDLYGDAFTQAYFIAEASGRPGLDRLMDRYGVVWTIFEPGNPIVSVLDADPNWKRIHTDPNAVVHQRIAEPTMIKTRSNPSG